MKIALLTIWRERNYGAELQAYATIKALQNLGHDAAMIDIRLSDSRKRNIKGVIADIVSLFGPATFKFERFWKKYIPVTARYRSIAELQSCPPEADIYLVGSDQVWNPDLTGDFAKLFFLDFGDDRVGRVSYASSFGVSEWDNETLTEDVKRLLRRFKQIACREQSGVDILSKTFDLPSYLTIDPTLLFDQYPELTGEVLPKQTLVYYPLSEDTELTGYAEKIAKQLNLQLVNNKAITRILGAIEWDRVGIEQWVRNIAESQFVITRSFHGLIFSILYSKSFAIVASQNNRSTRILNLLQQLGLADRYFESFSECDEAKPWNIPIDYATVHMKLSEMRRDSLDYLRENLR